MDIQSAVSLNRKWRSQNGADSRREIDERIQERGGETGARGMAFHVQNKGFNESDVREYRIR